MTRLGKAMMAVATVALLVVVNAAVLNANGLIGNAAAALLIANGLFVGFGLWFSSITQIQ